MEAHGNSKGSVAQQIGRLALNCIGNAQDVQKGDIALAPFDPANVGTIDMGVIGQGFLGNIHFHTPGAYRHSQSQ
jgi:hypothetical protein